MPLPLLSGRTSRGKSIIDVLIFGNGHVFVIIHLQINRFLELGILKITN